MEGILPWLVPILAVYGALLSTYNTWSMQHRSNMAQRRTLRVRAVRGMPVYDDGVDRGDLVSVYATNTGQRSIRVNSIELELPDGSHSLSKVRYGRVRHATSSNTQGWRRSGYPLPHVCPTSSLV